MKKLLLLILLNSVNYLFGQNIFESEEFGFSMEEPANWNVASNKEILKNTKKLKFTKEELDQILQSNKGSVLIKSFYKYNIKKHEGLIPTIQVRVRSMSLNRASNFKNSIEKSVEQLKGLLKNFELIEEPKDTSVSGIASVYFSCRYTIPDQEGNLIKTRSKTFAT